VAQGLCRQEAVGVGPRTHKTKPASQSGGLGEYKVSKQPIQNITRQDANAYRDNLAKRMSPNAVARYKNTLNAAYNWYIKENGLEATSPFAGLLIKGAGPSKIDRLPLSDDDINLFEPAMQDSDIAWALYVTLRDTGARIAEVAGLRVQDCDIEQGALQITVLKFSISL